jgi:hypothetical protein
MYTVIQLSFIVLSRVCVCVCFCVFVRTCTCILGENAVFWHLVLVHYVTNDCHLVGVGGDDVFFFSLLLQPCSLFPASLWQMIRTLLYQLNVFALVLFS